MTYNIPPPPTREWSLPREAVVKPPPEPTLPADTLSLPPPSSSGSSSESGGSAALKRLGSAVAITKLLQSRLGKYGTSFEKRAYEVEANRLATLAEQRANLDKALVMVQQEQVVTKKVLATYAAATPEPPVVATAAAAAAPIAAAKPPPATSYVSHVRFAPPKISPADLRANNAVASNIPTFANWQRIAAKVDELAAKARKPLPIGRYQASNNNYSTPKTMRGRHMAAAVATPPRRYINATMVANHFKRTKAMALPKPHNNNATNKLSPAALLMLMMPPPSWRLPNLLPSSWQKRWKVPTTNLSTAAAISHPPAPIAAAGASSGYPCVWLNTSNTKAKQSDNGCPPGCKCLPAPRRKGFKCLPAPLSAYRRALPTGWQPAGLLSWAGADTWSALVARDAACELVPLKNSSRRPHLPSSKPKTARRPLLPPPQQPSHANCAEMARAAAAEAARFVKSQADVALAAAAAAAARSAAELYEREKEAHDLRQRLSRSRESLKRKEAHLAQVEAVLGATAAREASAYAVLRKKSDATEQLLHGMGELHTELLTVQQREESARAALRSMSSQKDKLDSKIHELKRELNKVKKSAEGRLQQAKSLAAMHARSSRSEKRARRKERYLRAKVDELKEELAIAKGRKGYPSGARNGHRGGANASASGHRRHKRRPGYKF